MQPLFELKLKLAPAGSRRSAQVLYRELKAAILDGRLLAGARLPATRDAAHVFGLSRNTAAEAYERLVGEGLVATRRGSGTYVTSKPPKASRMLERKARSDSRLNPFWLREDVRSSLDFWREPPGTEAGAAIDFRPALIDTRLFPLDVFRRVSVQQLRRLEKKPASFKSPQGNQGHFPLRDATARHIALTRAVVCSAQDILVTAGAQQAFDVLARALVIPQKTLVAVEDPGYPPMRIPFAAAGAKLIAVPVDAEGIRVDRLPEETRVICVCPSHQFPLGISMSARRRRELVEFARKRGAVIVEDDYDGEFRYQGSPMEALRALDAEDVVFYVGTFSKCMWPALRLGFIVAPEWAMRTLVTAKNALDWHCPVPIQMGVARFMSEGHLKRHVRKLREVYRRRRDCLLGILSREFADWLEPIPSFYGMHVAALAKRPVDLEAVSLQLQKAQVKVHTLSRYYLGEPGRRGLIFGLGSVNEREIRSGLAALARALPNH
jgi:GntR family transcriptional regulator / MocR family aminotransferase